MWPLLLFANPFVANLDVDGEKREGPRAFSFASSKMPVMTDVEHHIYIAGFLRLTFRIVISSAAIGLQF